MVSFGAFILTSIDLLVNDDFTGMKIEARNFKHGEVAYGMVITWIAVIYFNWAFWVELVRFF
jgi:Purine nucleobase transmembrane transport